MLSFPIERVLSRRFRLPYLAGVMIIFAYVEAKRLRQPYSQWPRAGECA